MIICEKDPPRVRKFDLELKNVVHRADIFDGKNNTIYLPYEIYNAAFYFIALSFILEPNFNMTSLTADNTKYVFMLIKLTQTDDSPTENVRRNKNNFFFNTQIIMFRECWRLNGTLTH